MKNRNSTKKIAKNEIRFKKREATLWLEQCIRIHIRIRIRNCNVSGEQCRNRSENKERKRERPIRSMLIKYN